MQLPFPVQVLLTLATVTTLGPLLYRVAYQPLAEASVLVLLIVSVALHFTLVGLGLWFFGAEGSRTPAFSSTSFTIEGVNISVQSLLVVASSLALIGALALFFGRTLYGKALRATAVNRAGARLVGISPDFAGALTFTLAALLCAFSGVLIGPITTDLLRLGVPGRPQGLRRRHHRRTVELSDRRGRRVAGRPHRVVLVVLGQRVQGSDRVHADHPGAAVAQPDHDAPRGRRMKALGSRAAFAAVRRGAGHRSVGRPRVLGDARQLHRALQHRRARSGAADRRRGPDIVRTGGVRRTRRLHDRVPDARSTARRRGSRWPSGWRSPRPSRCSWASSRCA